MIILRYIDQPNNCIETYNAVNSAVYLNKSGNEVIIFSKKSKYLEELCKKNKVNYREINWFILSGLTRIPNSDIIEIYGYSKENDKIIKKLLELKKPKIMRIFNFLNSEMKEFLKTNYGIFSKIIVCCQSLKDDLIFNQIPSYNIFVLSPLLIMTRWESAKQIKPITILQRPYRICFVAKEPDTDDVKLFLLIAREVLARNDKVNFMIVGTRDDKIRNMARELGISHKVDILGWRDDMPEVMAMAHIYVSTKAKPRISRSLLEAIASGVVCISAATSGFSDFINNEYTGILVNRSDINEYVKNICELTNDPITMQNISAMSFAYARANFSADIVTKVEELIYEETLNAWLSKYI